MQLRSLVPIAAALLVASPLAGTAQAVTAARVQANIPVPGDNPAAGGASVGPAGMMTESASRTRGGGDATSLRQPASALQSTGLLAKREARSRGALRGALIGAGVGAGGVALLAAIDRVGGLGHTDADCVDASQRCNDSPSSFLFLDHPIQAGVAAALVGGAIGALAGAALARPGRERWVSVPLRALQVQPGSAAVPASVGFSLRM